MHIGFVTSDLSNNNGWATYSLNLIRAIRAQGIQTTVVSSRNCPDVEFDVHRLLPSVTPPERHTFARSMLQTIKLRQLMIDCDIIHATIEPFAILADMVAGKRPLFITAHGSYVNLPRLRKFPINRLYERAFRHAELICVSHYTAQVAQELIPAIKTHVINNGVDGSRFINPPPLPQPKTAPTVITSGGIKPRKGTLPLVQAMAIVREQIPDVQCLVMGNPQLNTAYSREVQATISRLGLEDTVHLMGFVEDDVMRAWFAEADVLALPSMNDGMWFEGFGLVVFEASAAGTAVIGTDNCGVADAIEHHVTGLIISQDNVADELPDAIINILTHPDKAKRMGEAGRIKAQAQTWDVVGQQVIERYEQSLMDDK